MSGSNAAAAAAAANGAALSNELLMQLNGLCGLQLVQRVSGEDQLDVVRYKCDAPLGTVAAAAVDVRFELAAYHDD